MGSVGTTSGTAYNYFWLRSGDDSSADFAYFLYVSGSNYVSNRVYGSCAVRPALHLNLNSAAQSAVDAVKTWDGTSTEAPTLQNPSASNSETNPYIIDTAAKLAYISANFSWADEKYFLQTENLDLNNEPWTPINNCSRNGPFYAYYYDGGGHTISNLYINTAEQTLNSNSYLGLFGRVGGSSSKSAYIKNLGIVGGSVSGGAYVGAVVGDAWYTDIINCFNENTSITCSSDNVGGVVGFSDEGTIINSYNTGAVSGNEDVGGVAGWNRDTTISNLYNTGTVIGDANVGGIVGTHSGGAISNSYNTGDVTGTGTSGMSYLSNVGGIVGFHSGTISNSYNTGDVTGDAAVGGVAGCNSGGTISNSYNTGTVTGNERVGGVVGWNQYTTAVVSNSYNTGDVTGSSTVGGVVASNYGTVSNSYNIGTVGGSSYVGGVVASNHGTVSNSYNEGAVTGSGSYVGGVAGNHTETISNSYNTGTVTGNERVGGVAGENWGGTISNSYNTGEITGTGYVGGVTGYVLGSSSSPVNISSCYSTGKISRSSGSNTYFGGVFGYVQNSRYVSISWCYYNKETSGSVVTKAIGFGTGYQVYGLTTAQMQGDKNQNYMYLSDTFWNFASGSYPTLKYVVQPQDDNEHTGGANQ